MSAAQRDRAFATLPLPLAVLVTSLKRFLLELEERPCFQHRPSGIERLLVKRAAGEALVTGREGGI